MKYILFIFIIAFTDYVFGQGDAPPLLQGQYQGSKSVGSFIQTPNAGVTKINSSTALIETGNNNILVNPSFEHQVFSTGWTVGSGTFTEETVNEIHGKKAASLVLSSQSMALHQDSTLYASQYADGVQGLASVRVKTSVSGIKVCAKQAGVTVTSLCVDVQASGKWGLYKVPFILGATSNGISINSNGASVTGAVYIDDAFVGAVDLKVDNSAISPWIDYGAISIGATTTAPTKGTTSLDKVRCRTSGQDYECEYRLEMTTAGTAGSGDYLLALPNGIHIDPGEHTFYTGTIAVNTYANELGAMIGEGYGGHIGAAQGDIQVIAYDQTRFRLYRKNFYSNSGVFGSGYFQLSNASHFFVKVKFRGKNLNSNISTYSSTVVNNIDRVGEIIFTTKSTAPNGFISALNSSIGQSGSGASFSGDIYYTLYEHLWNVPGLSTTAGDPYRISSAKGASALADWQANKTITVDYATNEVFVRAKGSARNVGSYQDSDNKAHTHNITTRISSGTAGANVISSSNTASTYTDTISINSSGGTESRPKNVALFAYIRFSGDTILAVAQLSGLESCTSTLECTDTFSAKVSSAGVVSDENVSSFINGNCTLATTTYTCNFTSGLFTVAPNCSLGISGGLINGANISTLSATQIVYNTANSGANGVAGINLVCQKQGVDYIGKTAKAVASDQNVSTPGTIKSTLCSAKISSTGVISDQKGGCFASCTNATTPVCTFTSNYWVSGQIPNCWVISTNGGLTSDVAVNSTTISGTLLTTTFTPYSSARNYFCHGERQ